MPKLYQILMLFLFTSSIALASDFSNWDRKSIAKRSWEYIRETKEELQKRALAVERFTGNKVNLDFIYITKLTPKGVRLHEKFLQLKMSEKDIAKHIAPFLRELEINRRLLATAEENAEKTWNEKNVKGELQEEASTENTLYGTQITSKKMGVILDNSNSMIDYLPALRNEIKDKFKHSYFVEIYGSIIKAKNYKDIIDGTWYYISPEKDENPFMKKWFCQAIPQQNPHYFSAGFKQSNLTAMAALIIKREVDTIYWFTDLRDKSRSYEIKQLHVLLAKNKVKLYVHSVSLKPKADLNEVIKRTGGEFIRAKVKK